MPYNVDIGKPIDEMYFRQEKVYICIEEAQVMGDSISCMLKSMETNIGRCEMLSNILAYKLDSKVIDMDKYIKKGYSEEEISIGMELIDLYLGLMSLIEKSKIVI